MRLIGQNSMNYVAHSVARLFAFGACAAILGLAPAASAHDDAGIADFFAHEFGFGAPAAQPSAPVWSEEDPYDRPLVVRPRHKRPKIAKVSPTPVVKGPVEKVSIYEDTTLRRGDAVMTASGMRIFRGAARPPYHDSDFIPVSQSDGLSRDVTKTLIAMDRVPRS